MSVLLELFLSSIYKNQLNINLQRIISLTFISFFIICNSYAEDNLIASCNKVSAYPNVSWKELDTGTAIPICKKASKAYPGNLDIQFQYARSLHKAEKYAEAREIYLPIANKGHALAQTNLGVMYLYEEGVKKDIYKARDWFLKAAKQGFVLAQYQLGLLYYNNKELENHFVEAKKWLKFAANQNHGMAQFFLANMYEEGLGGEQENERALKWYQLSANNGVVQAMYHLGLIYASGIEGVKPNLLKARKYFEKAADKKFPQGLYNLGLLYQEGKGGSKDCDKALKLYEEALVLKKLFPEPMNGLGTLYLEGCGVERNYSEALKWFQKAADLGSNNAAISVASHYQSGQGVEKDCVKAKQIYLKLLEKELMPEAMNNLATIYSEGCGEKRDYKKAFQWFKKSSELGNGVALSNIGFLYQKGRGVKKDCTKALSLHKKSLEKETSAQAMNNLGLLYDEGCGVEQDYKEALKWFKKSEKIGYPIATYNIGKLYRYGDGVTQNYEKALAYYQKAEKEGVAAAANGIGLMHYYGAGVELDYRKATEYFKRSAEMGNDVAQHNLAVSYETGKGINKDYAQAVYWYRSAAYQNHILSQIAIANTYKKGLGVVRDINQAIYWYEQAANNNDPTAQSELGLIYELGINGTKKDLTKARSWYKKAAKQNSSRANYHLGLMYATANGVTQNINKAEQFFLSAAKNNYIPALKQLAMLGGLNDENSKRIVKWTRIAAQQGDPVSQFAMGFFSETGFGMDVDKQEAIKWYKKASEKNIPDAMGRLSRYYDSLGKTKEALNLAKEASLLYIEDYESPFTHDTELEIPERQFIRRQHFIHLLDMLFRMSDISSDDRERDLAFDLFQFEHNRYDSYESYLSVIKQSAKNDSIKQTIYKLRTSIIEWHQLEEMQREILYSSKLKKAKFINTIYDSKSSLEKEIDQLNRKLLTESASLGFDMKPVSIADTQAMLHDDESLLLYLFGMKDIGSMHDSFVLLINKQGDPKLIPLKIDADELSQYVLEIRSSVPSTIGKNGKVKVPPAFATKKAHELYKKIFSPVEKYIKKGANVIVIADKALHSLPLSLLTRNVPNDPKNYRQTDWLVNHYAFSRLPSVQALKYIRPLDRKITVAKNAFLGVGDPKLEGSNKSKFSGAYRNFSNISNKRLSNIEILRKAPPLPDTALQLKKIADSIKNDKNSNSVLVLTQQNATEAVIKNLSELHKGARLDDYRVLAFATHGSLASESKINKGPTLPGLIFTPPTTATFEDDGYLTSVEVSSLELNADWVLLTACNTAVSEDTTAFGISELSNAFLFAGSRSVLASHWYAETHATTRLTINVFDKLAENPKMKRVDALRSSIREMIQYGLIGKDSCNLWCKILSKINPNNNQEKYANPSYWAPFVIYGETGALTH